MAIFIGGIILINQLRGPGRDEHADYYDYPMFVENEADDDDDE